MIALADLTLTLRGQMVVLGPGSGAPIDDLVVMESPREHIGGPGDLVLGVCLDTPKRALVAVERLGDRGAPGLVVRTRPAADPEVVAAAHRRGVALVALAENASWAHVIQVLREALNRAATGAPRTVADDLFALADAAAGLVEAAVTIEDARHRVLAYSSRHHRADPARVSTIVGRRVPAAVVSTLRAGGVFRRMARSDEPFFLAAGVTPDLGARFVVPVRAGGEWLGSIWCAVDAPPAAPAIEELRTMAAAVALQLLTHRAQTDLTRLVWLDRLRQSLVEPAADAATWLPTGPWRVVVLAGTPEPAGRPLSESARELPLLDLWVATLRRRGWPQPALVDVADGVFAIVTDAAPIARGREGHDPLARGRIAPSTVGRAGTWAWLRAAVEDVASAGCLVTACAATPSEVAADLPRARREALEVAELCAPHGDSTVRQADEVWPALTIARATRAVGGDRPFGPLAALAADPADQERDRHTLRAWLDHPGAPRRAAAELGVHVNTVRYRMDRIAALLDVDLDDSDVRLALQLLLRAHHTPAPFPPN